MIHRLVTTPLSPDDATIELNEIKTIPKINGYSEEFVDHIFTTNTRERGASKPWFLFWKETMHRRKDMPSRTNYKGFSGTIKLIWRNKGKLKDRLGNSKDKTEMLQKSGIYQVECEGCDSVYIGQTKRSQKHFLMNTTASSVWTIQINWILHDMPQQDERQPKTQHIVG
jgi:hypothetical protein